MVDLQVEEALIQKIASRAKNNDPAQDENPPAPIKEVEEEDLEKIGQKNGDEYKDEYAEENQDDIIMEILDEETQQK